MSEKKNIKDLTDHDIAVLVSKVISDAMDGEESLTFLREAAALVLDGDSELGKLYVYDETRLRCTMVHLMAGSGIAVFKALRDMMLIANKQTN